MAALPASVGQVYLAGCPRMFVDQLNMILNFGGRAQILTLSAPYTCTACGAESDEIVDAVAHTSEILAGRVPEKTCTKCNGRLVLDDTPEAYFACLTKYGPHDVEPTTMQLLSTDTRTLAKQVIKPELPTTLAPPSGSKSNIVWWVVFAVILAGLVAGLYVLISPS
jgi:hypothetical protein